MFRCGAADSLLHGGSLLSARINTAPLQGAVMAVGNHGSAGRDVQAWDNSKP